MPILKEPEFFSSPDAYARGSEWYRNLFVDAPPGVKSGEASTTYTRWPHTMNAAELISQHAPHARLIYIVRNPVDRAYSHYKHHMRERVTMSFEEALERDEIYFDCGNYMMQLARYTSRFDRNQIHVLLLEDLRDDAAQVLGEIQRFLGLRVIEQISEALERFNQDADGHYLRAKTFGRIRRLPALGPLIDRVPQDLRYRAFEFLKRSAVGRRIQAQRRVPPLQPETAGILAKRYAASVNELSEFMGRDLTYWLTKYYV